MEKRNELKIFSGNSNRPLAEKIVEYIGTRLGDCEISRFADGEINVRVNETVRGHDVFIVQSTSTPVNENLMELLVMVDAFKRASASSVAVVIPYYGYARQDRKARGRDPISAKLVANLITVAGASRVLTVDLHADQIQGFFDIPVDNLLSFPIFARHFLNMEGFDPEEWVVVSPDVGGVRRARQIAERLSTPLAILDKRRPRVNEAEIVNVIGDVENKYVILYDDIIDTARSMVEAAKAIKNKGAKKIVACATHGVFSLDALERIEKSDIERVYVSDTIHHENLPSFVEVLSVASLLGEAIMRIRKNLSVSIMFR
ncbi:MAG: ribose-phosphate pyrophosphokinase [Thermotogae bacterium]|nr:MAG: ribose-phosphate pyrophosphokinase [Thermotogota bacterium]